MNKIDMYKEVPKSFHNALCETLEQLEEEKIVKFSTKKFIITCAAAVLAASTLTVGAMELFQWYQVARNSLGTNQELENKLTNQGAALPAEDADVQQNITMTALQAVKKDEDFYLLAAMDWPKDLEWNDDILFEECEIRSVKESESSVVIQEELQQSAESEGVTVDAQDFGGFTVNFTGEPDENGTVYVEMLARGISGGNYSGDAKVVLSNLIQTEKTEYVDTLVEAEWELLFRLPTDADTMILEMTQPLLVNGHTLDLHYVEINPFGVKMYTDKEQGMHAVYYSNMELAAVLYEDGNRIDNYGGYLKTAGATDEAGKFYFNLQLQNAVDIDKVSDLVFMEDGKEIIYELSENAIKKDMDGNISVAEDMELISLKDLMAHHVGKDMADSIRVTDFRILYVRHDYVILMDNRYIYQWDALCDHAEIIADLTECDFDAANGGEVAMMPGGVVLAVHPTVDSAKVYMVETDIHDMYEADGENIWPVPRYEDYQNSFFAVADREGLHEGIYAPKGYEVQGSAYVLYSTDGSVEQIKLLDLNRNK